MRSSLPIYSFYAISLLNIKTFREEQEFLVPEIEELILVNNDSVQIKQN